MRVIDILRHKGHDVTTIRPDASVEEAVQLLADRGIGAVVVSEDGSTVQGVLFERDVIRHLSRAGREGMDTPVERVMTTDIRLCGSNDSVEDLMRTMTLTRLRHLPVTEDGQLFGIVSIGDVVERRLDELEHEQEHLRLYIQTGR